MNYHELSCDDHYIPNAHNAHLRLDDFEDKLRALVKKSRQRGVGNKEIVERLYCHAVSNLTQSPDEPEDDRLVCRFLTPKKFLWFLSTKEIRFCSAQEFDDPRECSLPEDYENAVGKVLCEFKLPPSEWDNQILSKGQDWLVSCWTELNSCHDDNLIWHKYAEGPEGVGITIRYGQLKLCLKKGVERIDGRLRLTAGRVNYEYPLRILPFNKRRMFRRESEVRFACHPSQRARDLRVDISGVFKNFGLRFSPDAPDHHRQAVKKSWIESGGVDRFQEPDGG